LCYSRDIQPSCTEPFRLIAHARKNSKRLLCGLFCNRRKAGLEVKMAITGQNDRRKNNRRQDTRRKGDIKVIRIEGDKEQSVAVRHENVSQRKERSIWSWHEEFVIAWSETLITKKQKRNPRKGE
jgi:hypothetical protein